VEVQKRDGINRDAALEQLLDDYALAGFHARSHARAEGGELLTPALPAGCGVFDLEVGHHLSAMIYDDDVVVIFGPVEAGVVSDFIPGWHVIFPALCIARSQASRHRSN
jgi:hypothetical protein